MNRHHRAALWRVTDRPAFRMHATAALVAGCIALPFILWSI